MKPGQTPKPTKHTTRIRADKVTCSCGYAQRFPQATKRQARDDHAGTHR